jgi:ethanolamine-phosphate cytidylyltransferase
VNQRRGMNLPLLNLHERVLSVLGCRHVDDVLIDAPYQITPEMISSLRLSEIIHGTISDNASDPDHDGERYRFAKEANIFSIFESPSQFRLENIVKRIHRNEEIFQVRFEKKMKAEKNHYQKKYSGS